MSQVTVEEAALRLPELIRESAAGEEIVLTQNGLPAAKLVPLKSERPQPKRGSGKEFIRYVADDFDATPEGFEEYMP